MLKSIEKLLMPVVNNSQKFKLIGPSQMLTQSKFLHKASQPHKDKEEKKSDSRRKKKLKTAISNIKDDISSTMISELEDLREVKGLLEDIQFSNLKLKEDIKYLKGRSGDLKLSELEKPEDDTGFNTNSIIYDEMCLSFMNEQKRYKGQNSTTYMESLNPRLNFENKQKYYAEQFLMRKKFEHRKFYENEKKILNHISHQRTQKITDGNFLIQMVNANDSHLTIEYTPVGVAVTEFMTIKQLENLFRCMEELYLCNIIHRDLTPRHFMWKLNKEEKIDHLVLIGYEFAVIKQDKHLVNFSGSSHLAANSILESLGDKNGGGLYEPCFCHDWESLIKLIYIRIFPDVKGRLDDIRLNNFKKILNFWKNEEASLEESDWFKRALKIARNSCELNELDFLKLFVVEKLSKILKKE